MLAGGAVFTPLIPVFTEVLELVTGPTRDAALPANRFSCTTVQGSGYGGPRPAAGSTVTMALVYCVLGLGIHSACLRAAEKDGCYDMDR